MNQCFGERMKDGTFKKEKRYLFTTLISFSISYLVDVSRNGAIFAILLNTNNTDTTKKLKAQIFFCENNLNMSAFNAITFIIVELTPYMIIFCLNHSNFRKAGKKDKYTADRIQSSQDKSSEQSRANKKHNQQRLRSDDDSMSNTNEIKRANTGGGSFYTVAMLRSTESVINK